MHASIPRRVFVSVTADSVQAKMIRQATQFSILSIGLSIFWSSAAFAQNSYLGSWNPQRKTDQIPQPDDSHNRSLKPAGSIQNPQGHSVLEVQPDQHSSDRLPSSDSHKKNELQPRPFRTTTDTPVLIPDSPSEATFTSPDFSIEASPVLSTGSEDRYADDQHGPDHQNLVQPTNFEEPDQPSGTFTGSAFSGSQLDGEALDRACRWIDQYRITSGPNQAGLNFQPVSLVELIRKPAVAQMRSEMIVQYWETWSQWAELNSRIQFGTWINNIRASGSQSDSQILSQSKSQAQIQILEARASLANAQTGMQSFMLPSISALLPLPSDSPLIHPYVTNYQLYQNYRSMPEKFRNIDRELEDNLNLIVNQTNSVESARSAAESQLRTYQDGRGSLNSAIMAAQTWRSAEMQLIRAVAQYNQKIADYAINVTDGKLAPETVAAMLIGKLGNKRAIGNSNNNANLNSRSTMPSAQSQNGLVNRELRSGANQPVVENRNNSESPISSSLSRQATAQPFSGSSFRSNDSPPRENSRSTQPDPFRQNLAAEQPVLPPFQGESEPKSPHQALSQPSNPSNESQAQFGGFSTRPASDRNDFGYSDANSTSGHSNSNVVKQPIRTSNAKAGDFSPSIGSPNRNPTNPGSFSPASPASSASGQFNPLAPLPNPSARSAARQTKSGTPFSVPDSGKFDRVKSSGGGSINPPPNGSTRPTGERPSHSAGSNPSNGMFSPPSFNPPSRSADRAKQGSLPEVDDAGLLGESTESEAGSILPPENNGSDRQKDPNR